MWHHDGSKNKRFTANPQGNSKELLRLTFGFFRDRLRAVQCPSDMIDQMGGWSTAGVGQSYGEGYSLNVSSEWLKSIVQYQSLKTGI
jgi:hypothetical protein